MLVQTARIVHHGFSSAADIVKGPSLLRTTVSARPRPNLLHLQDLRRAQFSAEAPNNQSFADSNVEQRGGHNRVALGDPTASSVVERLEANWEAIYMERIPSGGTWLDTFPTLYDPYPSHKRRAVKPLKGVWLCIARIVRRIFVTL
jgi:hypothetical protein